LGQVWGGPDQVRSCLIRQLEFLHVKAVFRIAKSENAASQKIFSSRENVFHIEKKKAKPLIFIGFYLLLYKT